ncbi:MAG: beta-propeller fold lactonase family protein [Acidobacteria bacterium]|nr:beta-propeller fold lactonase family protein [Acidobacteriota bacterium]
MKLSRIGRASLATIASLAMGLGMTACGGGTVAFLWVTAAKTTSNGAGNSITGFKVDDYTGNLTEMVKSPYPSNGTNPAMSVLAPGGRFLFVVNQGDGTPQHAGAGISVFSVGGDGVLNFQQSYLPPFPGSGTTQDYASPVWLQMDSSGQHLLVLTSRAPIASNGSATPYGCTVADCGAVFVYSVAGDTGRLTLVQNQQVKVNGLAITYFPTGPRPFQMKLVAGGFLVIANSGDQSVTIYNTSNNDGQLTLAGNQMTIQTNVSSISSVTSGGTYLYLTDGALNKIYAYTVSANGLGSVVGSPFDNNQVVVGSKPVWTATDARAKFLFVLNQQTSSVNCQNTNACNSISAYNIESTGKLTPISGINNPYRVGAGPTCMLQDPSNKYVYTSNSLDSTVTGYEINQATGELNVLRRGSTFSVTGQPTCLVASGSVD